MVCTVMESSTRQFTQASFLGPVEVCVKAVGFLPESHVLHQPAAQESSGLPEAVE